MDHYQTSPVDRGLKMLQPFFSFFNEVIQYGRHDRLLEIPCRTTPPEPLLIAYLEYGPVIKLKVCDFNNGRHDAILKIKNYAKMPTSSKMVLSDLLLTFVFIENSRWTSHLLIIQSSYCSGNFT